MLDFRNLITNPLTVIMRVVFLKVNFVMTCIVLILMYYVFNGLNEAGILKASYNAVITTSYRLKAATQQCTKYLGDVKALVSCVNSTKDYTPSKQVLDIERQIESVNIFNNDGSIDTDTSGIKSNNIFQEKHSPYELYLKKQENSGSN
jgi:hypothetical protein